MGRQQRSARPKAVRRRSGLRPVPLLVGLGVSVAAHLVVIVLYSSRVRLSIPDVVVVPVSVSAPDPDVMEVVQIVEMATPPAVPEEPAPLEDIEEEAGPEGPEADTEIVPILPERYRSAAERLRLGPGDPRIWQPIDPMLAEPTPEQILNIRLAILIAEGNDSAAAEADALARAMDWTHTGEDGKRWGLSPGMIHLGDVSIPLPFGFGAPYDFSGERAEAAFRMNDIQRAAGTLAARQSWRERMEAMRKRREERRAAEQAARTLAPPVAKPDTSFSRPGPR